MFCITVITVGFLFTRLICTLASSPGECDACLFGTVMRCLHVRLLCLLGDLHLLTVDLDEDKGDLSTPFPTVSRDSRLST